MSTNKQNEAKQSLLKQIEQLSKIDLKQQIQWLLRSLLVRGRSNLETGFVLPTVAMVSLVVVLLSVALVVRAFDRSKNASNVRVNQVVLNAATPALDRAKAKLDALFRDPTLPRTTPSDIALDIAINSNPNRYKFGDETRLKLVNEFNGTAGIQKQPATTLEGDETINTAWKYPVDTDNNGLFDSYTLYGIYFRSPTRDANGKFNRQRNPLEARTPPMSGGYLGSQCNNATGTTANLVGDSSWYKIGSKLTKSFYVYTATVPITNPPTGDTTYEAYKGNKGFTALEYQQDRSQIPLNNNAVLFQDDLELSPGPAFRLNGRVFTNANLLIGGHGGAIRLFQVSSKNSCYYKEENAKINVGGNVGTGNINDTTNQTSVDVDLYNGSGNDPITGKVIDGSNKSTTSTGGAAVGYNDTAYNNRIALMKRTALSYSTTNPPTIASVEAVTQYPTKEIKESFKAKVTANPSLYTQDVLAEQIEIYLKDRTRRVPYAEVATPDTNAIGTFTTTNVFATGTIEPPTAWREPTDANTGLTLSTTQLEQTDPDKQKELGKEVLLGDRINVGNNLPAYWKNTLGKFVTGPFERQPLGSTIFWNNPADKPRFRTTQVVALPDLGISDRTGFWEDAAAQTPATIGSNVGGLRVVTGAGIYVDTEDTATPQNRYFTTLVSSDLSKASFLRKPQLDTGITAPSPFTTASITTGNDNIYVWSDMMPMTGGATETAGANRKGDLQMRATAIYHYKDTSYTNTNYINRTPTACISSYYDPTNSATAKNIAIDGGYGIDAINGRSNNGVVYPSPYATDATRVTAVGTYRGQLNRQARLVFPNGRIVNQQLRDALKKIDASGTRSLADNSAIDTAICGIRILTDTGFLPSATPPIAHGAIKESSFLDARQAKALDRKPGLDSSGNRFIEPISSTELDATGADGNYNLQLEQRQPLEIRVTDIDINLLRTKTIGGTTNQEYMLPNSGIIYATREDALLDLSNTTSQKELLSPTDFKLDPTRRPNGIRLINGSNLARDNNFRAEEKGLILVTNLPLYIKGNFNLHQKPGGGALREEFTATLDNTWSNFYSRTAATLNTNFACRINQPGCGTEGDQWRPATIISDATSLMSTGFADGFRDLGDYDLNNNAGFSTIANRLKNGFFENSFATSSLWWNTANTANNPFPSGKTTNSHVSSYLTNGVSPVQRRTDFPEYVMEICRKIPVSECQPGDWVVGYDSDNNGVILTTEQDIKARNLPTSAAASQLVAGTTAKPALQATDLRYARRVAFKRKNSNTLELTAWASPNEDSYTPIPIGVNSVGQVADFPYNNAINVPRVVNNSLWFRTTSNTIGRPFCSGNNIPAGSGCTADSRVYADSKPLYYDGTTKLISPPTPEVPGVPSLNSPIGNPASGYTVCTEQNTSGSSNTKVLVDAPGDLDLGRCSSQPGNPMAQIELARAGFLALNPSASSADNIVVPNRTGTIGTFPGLTTVGQTTIFTTNNASAGNLSEPVVNVIEINGDFTTTVLCTKVKLVGDANSIFVLRKTTNSELGFGGSSIDCGVQVELDGVEPNNVFWASNGNVKWNAVNTDSAKHHKMVGTFITDSTGSPKWETVDFDEGGRILGPNGVPSPSNFNNSKIYAIATNAQPVLTPVLQVHSPGGTPATSLNTTTSSIQADWIQQPSGETTFNAAFVTGNSPSRPAEESAGLHNFVRFMERWSNTTVNIKGSFIQLKKSAYATGTFSPIRSTGAAPIVGSDNGSLSIFNYSKTLYPQAGGGSTLTFYSAPTRQWGFDVALLTQPPDLFAQRFTQQSNTAPDEFFRQVGQDDPWVQNLLCAAQGSASNYTAAIGDQRPANCPALTAYND